MIEGHACAPAEKGELVPGRGGLPVLPSIDPQAGERCESSDVSGNELFDVG
jgi:hypothetical protein